MSFSSDRTKQSQEVLLSTKINKSTHPPLCFSNASIKITHSQKHLSLQLDNKLSFNKHTNNKTNSCTAISIMQTEPSLWMRNIAISFSTVRDSILISPLLCGDDKFGDTKNRKILMSAIRFIRYLQRMMQQLDEQFWWWTASFLKYCSLLPPQLWLRCHCCFRFTEMFLCFAFSKSLFYT